ncbi:hypothetical protein [Gemmatimonas sp.]|jgi:hypothetical protein|uniref:hypothetical protein n=1 Tax=Gemmatimonas sp. TaxID=1962908 RepID=UPI0022CA2EB1|nr:hypothetical protein [Gemmatimonas sp.]MCZ8203786.1 hypothetical protein [Gemmatimonas sp.]
MLLPTATLPTDQLFRRVLGRAEALITDSRHQPAYRMNTASGLLSPEGIVCLRWQVRPAIDGLENNLGRSLICQLLDAFDASR